MELYNKLPTTLQTSGAIARIGKLLKNSGTDVYYYCLFMEGGHLSTPPKSEAIPFYPEFNAFFVLNFLLVFPVGVVLNVFFLGSAAQAIFKDLIGFWPLIASRCLSSRNPGGASLHIAFLVKSLHSTLFAKWAFKFFFSFPSETCHSIT